MRTPEGDKIFAIIRAHVGADAAITAPQICRELRWSRGRERTVRQIISDESLLWEKVIVCSIPGKGYFIAETHEEIIQYDNWLSELASKAQDKLQFFRRACHRFGFNLRRAA